MELTQDQRDLDEVKKRYLDAEAEIERLRIKIALSKCPIKLGDKVPVIDGKKELEFVVEYIGYAIHRSSGDDELLRPVIGAETGWSASGSRIKKTDGKKGSWQFSIDSLTFEFVDRCWKRKTSDLADLFPSGTTSK